MAHAVRFNLRMQKELKLLLSDPPPGVSLVTNSDDGCPTSLENIEARIRGPEGTVYDKGIFHVRVKLPERYPFQPPNVTFVTPIYHPNIDNGGRICLDILNLPPKGAWQPSLNISTVLTSIILLLSEPNPDDGLMCETSREYKYERQIFDQKARLWTEKYAIGGIDASKQGNELEAEAIKALPDESHRDNENSQKKCCRVGERLHRRSETDVNKERSRDYENAQDLGSNQRRMNCDETVTINNHSMHRSCKNGEDVCKGSKMMGAIIVSDSEESDGENNRAAQFRLSLGRARRPPKRKLERSI